MSNRRLPKVSGEAFSSKRARERGSKRMIPRALRRAAKEMPASLGTALNDLIYFCRKNGIDLKPLTSAVIDRAAELLRATGLKSANARILAWRRAVDALSDECKREFRVTEKLVLPRGKRLLSEPKGTFELLEADIAAAIEEAVRPPTDLLDPHQPVSRKTAEAAGKRIMIIAATLHRAGLAGTDLRLGELLELSRIESFLRAFYNRFDLPGADDAPNGTGDEARSDADQGVEPARKRTKGAWLADDLGALRFFAVRLLGRDSDAAVFAAAQGGRGKDRICLTGPQTLQLTQLTQASRVKELRGLCGVLMGYAESETHFGGSKRLAARMRSANLAVAVSVQLDLLLRPMELVTLACPLAKAELIVTSADGAVRLEPVKDLSELSRAMLRRRAAVLLEMERPSALLFPSNDPSKPQDLKSVCSSLGKILAKHGFPNVTMQVLRDLGAVALLRADPKNVRRVMILLGLRSVRSVYRRFAAFLKGV